MFAGLQRQGAAEARSLTEAPSLSAKSMCCVDLCPVAAVSHTIGSAQAMSTMEQQSDRGALIVVVKSWRPHSDLPFPPGPARSSPLYIILLSWVSEGIGSGNTKVAFIASDLLPHSTAACAFRSIGPFGATFSPSAPSKCQAP